MQIFFKKNILFAKKKRIFALIEINISKIFILLKKHSCYFTQKIFVTTMLPTLFNLKIGFSLKSVSTALLIIVTTNWLTYSFIKPTLSHSESASLMRFDKKNTPAKPEVQLSEQKKLATELYLLDQAAVYVTEPYVFAKKIRQISQKLNIAPEWLMAVIYAESKFDASIQNLKGSKAVGLIQFTPETARKLNTTTAQLKNLNPVEQLDYVYDYLKLTQAENNLKYNDLTTLYMALLRPEYAGEEYCYTLFAQPTETYKQNAILDENKDGRVTLQDIDNRLKRLFPTAYAVQKPEYKWWKWW